MRREESAGLTLVGLGPGPLRSLTAEARLLLRQAESICLRTLRHPVAQYLAERHRVHAVDVLFEHVGNAGSSLGTIVAHVLALAQSPVGVVYAVPGDPLLDDASARYVLRAARASGITTRVVAGVSLSTTAVATLNVGLPETGLQMLDAAEVVTLVRPAQPEPDEERWRRLLSPRTLRPTVATLISQPRGGSPQLTELKEALLTLYPPEHQVTLVEYAGVRGTQKTTALALRDIDRQVWRNVACLYLPPLAILDDRKAFETFQHIVAKLRAPGGCPWDREQTHQSLKPYLVEESYEVLEALDGGDPAALEEELGDLLLQIVLHTQLAAESNEFSMSDVLAHITAKLIRRHPHVFGDRSVADAAEVVRNWEEIKRTEKGEEKDEEGSLLGGLPKEMPALAHAASIQRRVATVGFEWEDAAGALEKVAEEARELREATTDEEQRDEFGDLLFALVSTGRQLGINAEEALRLANRRFVDRFKRLEGLARERRVLLKELSGAELERLWRQAKAR